MPLNQTSNLPTSLVERLHHRILKTRIDIPRALSLPEPKHALYDTQFRGRRIQSRHRKPIINHHARAHHTTTPINTTSDKRYLQQRREFVLVQNGGLGVHDAALVGQRHVGADEHVVGDGLPEDVDAQHVGDYLFGFALEIGVYEGDVVVADYDVAEGGEALFYPLVGVSSDEVELEDLREANG